MKYSWWIIASFLLICSPKAFSQEVLSYTMSHCLGSEYKIDPWSFGLDIDTSYMSNDSITMVGTMLANCGDHNLVYIKCHGDTMNIEFTDTGDVVKCTCWRQFELKFRCPFFPEFTYFLINPSWGTEFTYYRPDTTYLTDNTIWTYGILNTDPIQQLGALYQYSIQGDTVLDEITYRKVRSKDGYQWGIRESSKKIFARDLRYPNSTDLLLYDFNLGIGDEIEVDGSLGYSGFGLHVTQVDSITLDNGERRKRIVVGYNYTWIEGIGDIRSLFAPVEPIPTCISCPSTLSRLVCFKQQGSIVYSNQQYCQTDCCAFTDGSGMQTQILPDVDVFVIPEINELVVWMTKDETPVVFVRLIDSSGKVVRATPVDGQNKLSLNIAGIQKGIYLVEINTIRSRMVKKIVW